MTNEIITDQVIIEDGNNFTGKIDKDADIKLLLQHSNERQMIDIIQQNPSAIQST